MKLFNLLIFPFILLLSACLFDEKAKIIDEPPTISRTEFFGWSLAISGDIAAIGTPEAYNQSNVETGAVTVVSRGGGEWTSIRQRISPESLQVKDYFGFSVDIDQSSLIVGANHVDQSMGAAMIYARTGINDWNLDATLAASDRAPGDNFGISVVVHEDYAIIGASQDDNANGSKAGAVYVFSRKSGPWIQDIKLMASNGGSDRFGSAIAMHGNYLVVGAPLHNSGGYQYVGAIYILSGMS